MKSALMIMVLTLGFSVVQAEPVEQPYSAFSFTVTKEIQGTPEEVFDRATGDITAWWDHSMSDDPYKMYVEPKPGGAFMEIFNEEGDGVRHAVVTYAERGKMLRYEGPLGMAGLALHMVTTWTFTAVETEPGPFVQSFDNEATLVTIEVRAAGEVQKEWPAIIQKTWEHFLDQLANFQDC